MDTDSSSRVHVERAALLSPTNQNVSWGYMKVHISAQTGRNIHLIIWWQGTPLLTAVDPWGRGGFNGFIKWHISWFQYIQRIYTKKEGHTHNWTILASISFFSRGPCRTSKASITLPTRGSSISPYALGSIFTRRTSRTSRSRITLEVTHVMTLLHMWHSKKTSVSRFQSLFVLHWKTMASVQGL